MTHQPGWCVTNAPYGATVASTLTQQTDQLRNIPYRAEVADHFHARFEVIAGKIRERCERPVFAFDVGPGDAEHRRTFGCIDRARIAPAIPGPDRHDRA